MCIALVPLRSAALPKEKIRKLRTLAFVLRSGLCAVLTQRFGLGVRGRLRGFRPRGFFLDMDDPHRVRSGYNAIAIFLGLLLGEFGTKIHDGRRVVYPKEQDNQ